MDIKEYIERKQKIQKSLLEFINNDENIEENFENFLKIIKEQNILQDRLELKATLYLLLQIANYHYRPPSFFDKIERIFKFLKKSIQKIFTNTEIFHIFHGNKRLLLFFIEENMFTIDDDIFDFMSKEEYQNFNYLEYFFTEIKDFLNEDFISDIENEVDELKANDLNKFNEKRKKGENDQHICYLIQNDLIDKFISYINQNCIGLQSEIEISIYETNTFLCKYKINLIKYAAFYGSVQIFKYLYKNGNELLLDLCPYIIHGQHPEIIQIFIDSWNNNFDESNADILFIESLIFHNIDASNFVLQNYCKNVSFDDADFLSNLFKFYNYAYFPNKFDDETVFYYLCKYDYYYIVEMLLKTVKIDINQVISTVFKLFLKK